MPPQNQFNAWADTYDDIVDQNPTGYPFEGYHETLRFIRERIQIDSAHTRILDLGIGTGLLSRPLYDKGAMIYGVDSSPKMLNTARKHMPNGRFHEGDIAGDITGMFGETTFHYIISSYAMHHFVDEKKIQLIDLFHDHLENGGEIIIGDIAFETETDRMACQNKYADSWDHDEYYFTADMMIARLEERRLEAEYHQISICSGVLIIH